MFTRPPCWLEGQTCPNACARQLHEREIYNRTDLTGPWSGWHMRGRDLVSPTKDRITPERLRGLMFRQDAECRLAEARARNAASVATPQLVRVVVVNLAEYRLRGLGAA